MNSCEADVVQLVPCLVGALVEDGVHRDLVIIL